MPEPTVDSAAAPLLTARGVVKLFPGVRALDGVDFTLRRGEIHTIMGENGAGKSTLIKVLTGVYARDGGEVILDGQPIHPRSPLDAQKLGISTVYQEVNLVPYLSVAENMFLGRQPRDISWALRLLAIAVPAVILLDALFFALLVNLFNVTRIGNALGSAWPSIRQGILLTEFVAGMVFLPVGCALAVLGSVRWSRINRRAAEAMRRLDLDIDVTLPLNTYSIAVQQLVAIARALDVQAKVLILDEPTSSLTAKEVERLFAVMQRLKAEGLGIVFVSHFLDQVYAISDRLTVLRNGRFVGEYEAAKLPRLELIARMLGKDVQSVQQMTGRHAQACATEQRSLVRAQNLGRAGTLHPIDIEFRSGEIVGLAGLLGSGRTETARLLFGIDKPDSGQIDVDGKPAAIRSPRHAIAVGFGFTPEDRKNEGIIPELSIRENIILALQARRGWFRPLRRAQQEELADHYVKALNIATPDAEKPIGQLSGGNQQKALLARWLASKPRFLIVDEPTRGIDVGAKAEIERLLSDLCKDGLAVLFISSELEEVARDCHRVIVLRDRRKVGELTGDDRTVQNIMRLIASEGN